MVLSTLEKDPALEMSIRELIITCTAAGLEGKEGEWSIWYSVTFYSRGTDYGNVLHAHAYF